MASVLFCNEIKALEGNVTDAIASMLDPAFASIVEIPGLVAPIFDEEMVNWNELLRRFGGSLSCFVNDYPRVADKLQRPVINTVVDRVTNGSGSVTFHVQKIIPVKNMTLTINSITISGLDSFTDISLVSSIPTSNISIASSVSLELLNISLNLTYSDPSAQGYTEELIMIAGLVDNVLQVITTLAMNAETLASFYLDQVTQQACVFGAVEFFNVTSLSVCVPL